MKGLTLLFLLPLLALAERKPNVLVIMADDIGFECYSSYGSEFYKTPNIDKLAETGAKFTRAYANPICTPSRVKIMTGRYNFRNYTKFGELNLKENTFAKVAKQAGYATGVAGKWQLSEDNFKGPNEAGFDEYCLWHFNAKNKGSRFKSPKMYLNGKEMPDNEGKYGPDLATDFLCDFMERNREKPFVAYYPMILVHSPFVPTPDSVDWEVVKGKKRSSLQYFREMVHYMDKVIGRLVTKLDELELCEDTLIIVTGDNGTHRNLRSPFPPRGHIRGGKGLTIDDGTHVAFVANWRGVVKPGTIIDKPVDHASIMPTVAQLAGVAVPDTADGQSLLPLLTGKHAMARDWIFVSYNRDRNVGMRCFVREGDWKLYADGPMYNVPKDLMERTPIADGEHLEIRKRLQARLDKILAGAPEGRIQMQSK